MDLTKQSPFIDILSLGPDCISPFVHILSFSAVCIIDKQSALSSSSLTAHDSKGTTKQEQNKTKTLRRIFLL